MDILVGPISGQHIVGQLAALDALSAFKYRPTISMGASGGAVAILCYHGGDYTSQGLERVIKDLNCENFVEPWMPGLPSAAIGFFQGAFYCHPRDNMQYIRNNIAPGILLDNEIWIQTYDMRSERTNVWCSKREGESKLYVDPKMATEMNVNPVRFIGGDMDLYCKVAKASSAIPSILPPVMIGVERHVDGGVAYSSPIIPLQKSIKELGNIHIIYIIGSNIHVNDSIVKADDNPSLLDTVNVIVRYLLKSNINQDRIAGYQIISTMCDDVAEDDITLGSYFQRRDEWESSFLEITPGETKVIKLMSFTGEELVKVYKSMVPDLKCRVRYRRKGCSDGKCANRGGEPRPLIR